MPRHLRESVLSTELAKWLELQHIGPALPLTQITSFKDTKLPGSLAFSTTTTWSAESLSETCVISPTVPETINHRSSFIVSAYPRFDFARALGIIENKIGFLPLVENPSVSPSVQIGQNSWIDQNVQIGSGTVIGHNVVIRDGVKIGKGCVIKSNSVIGENGFGFERDPINGNPLRIPHLGGVHIGDYVEIGSLNTICRGTLDYTIIDDHSKLDDHVHIGHNCRIGKRVLIAACAEFSGSIQMGDNVWVAPNVSIMQKVKIGDNCLVGLGAVVFKNVEAGTTVIGNPAKPLR